MKKRRQRAYNPERRLAAAVCRLAVNDMVKAPKGSKINPKRIQREAITWLASTASRQTFHALGFDIVRVLRAVGWLDYALEVWVDLTPDQQLVVRPVVELLEG